MYVSGTRAAGRNEKFGVPVADTVEDRAEGAGCIGKPCRRAIQDIKQPGDQHKEQGGDEIVVPDQDTGKEGCDDAADGKAVRGKAQPGAEFSEKQGPIFIRLSRIRFHLATSRFALLKTGAQKPALPPSPHLQVVLVEKLHSKAFSQKMSGIK
jgi:hypothetical protein